MSMCGSWLCPADRLTDVYVNVWKLLTTSAAAAAAAGCDVTRVTQRSGLWTVQDQLQPIGCQDVQWPISCAEDCESLWLSMSGHV